MLQAQESDFLQQDLSGVENGIPYSQPPLNNVCPEWNLTDGMCQSNGLPQEKEYGFGSLPCCTPLQGTLSDPSWNMSFQFNGNQYSSSACCLFDQGKRPTEMVPSQMINDIDTAPYMKDLIENCSGIPKQGSSSDYRLLNYPQPQNIYNTPFPAQEPLIYPPYTTNSSSSYGYCFENDCLDKLCSPSRNNFSSCVLDQNMEVANMSRPCPSPKFPGNGSSELSGLLSITEESTDLQVNDSDEDSDIIVEDSDTESEISIDVGPYIGEKEVVKVTVMRCFVCNLSYSEESQSNFVQVNSSFPLTFISQTPVMLKLIEIIPIDMQTSVKFENNLICRRCLNLIDTIENLEVRLVSVKKAICDFVSRSGKDVEEDLNLLQENIDVCINYDENSQKEASKGSAEDISISKMVSTGVNTEANEDVTAGKEVLKEPEIQKTNDREKTTDSLSLELKFYLCDRCGKTYKRVNELNHHLSKHEGKFTERCSDCGKGFMKNRNLELHMRKHRKHMCLHCRASFTEETSLADHLLVCEESKFICNECPLLFTTKEKLEAHLEKHKKVPNICEICSKSFKHPSGLEAHKKSHSEEKPFSCDKCGLKYKNQSHLRRHQKSHELPFNCPVCRAMFSSSAELQRHSSQHTDKIECDECHKVFSSKSNMMEHKKIHSGTQTKKECHICKKLVSSNFDAHVLSHSEEKKYKCEICNVDFTFKHSMVKHMKRKHELNNSTK